MKQMVRKSTTVWFLLALLLLGVGCSQKSETVPKPFFIAPTGFLMGDVEPCKCPGNPLGGLARRAHQMPLMLRWPDATLKVDAGSFVSLDRAISKPQSELMLVGLNKLGVHAINLARRDLQLGLPFLHELEQTYKLPFVSANILVAETNELAFDAYRIVHLQTESGPLDVAVIGATIGDGRFLPPELGVAITPAPEALRSVLDKLKEKVGAVVLLTDGDRRTTAEWIKQISAENEISAVLSTTLNPSRSTVIDVAGVPYTTSGRQGKFFDLVELTPGKEGAWKMEKKGWPLDTTVPDDPGMVTFLDEMRSRLGLDTASKE